MQSFVDATGSAAERDVDRLFIEKAFEHTQPRAVQREWNHAVAALATFALHLNCVPQFFADLL